MTIRSNIIIVRHTFFVNYNYYRGDTQSGVTASDDFPILQEAGHECRDSYYRTSVLQLGMLGSELRSQPSLSGCFTQNKL